jgi:enoyl-CoA hydratase/carnithine racemase
LLASLDDGVATITFNRPARRNALSRALLADLSDALSESVVGSARAVLLQGASGCFSSGADLSELDGTLADLEFDAAIAGVTNAIRRLEIPVLAAIEGPCVGAAVEVALACDVRVAAKNAFFEVPAVRLGILYRPAALVSLSRRMPLAVLSRLFLFGERLGADAAGTLGLASPIVPEGRALWEARELTRRLPAAGWPAARATKQLLAEIEDCTADLDSWEATRRALAVSSERAEALDRARSRPTETRAR